VQPDDVLLNITGDGVTFGRACLAPTRILPARVNQHVAIIRADPSLAVSGYILLYLTHPLVKKYIESFNAGGSRRAITKGHIESFQIPLPALTEQRAIAAILGALDDKIELNRRMNETLEAMARAIFKSWFVDFDPVRAKMEGRQPAGTDADTAALFPDAFEDSPLGQIPQGWRIGMLGMIATNQRRPVDPSAIDASIPYIGLEHMPRQSIALSEWGCAGDIASGKAKFLRGEILFGKLRPYFHKVGVAPLDGVSSTGILTVTPKAAAWFGFLLGHLSSVELINHADACSTGTKMPRVSWTDVARYEIALPPEENATAFASVTQPLVDKILNHILQSHNLAAIRDALLPKLLSGEIRVGEAEKAVEMAL